ARCSRLNPSGERIFTTVSYVRRVPFLTIFHFYGRQVAPRRGRVGRMSTMWKLDHVVSASVVDVEERRLAEVLANAGYDVGKLTLNGLAQQVLAERAKAVVMAIGIEPSNWPHYPLGNGGVEVRFQFSREEDQVNAKLALA
ncbi:hypothetical protein, partial [Brevundimonas vesicularis]